jgi:MFS transporter, ACS family, D-galactonate transporter
MSDSVTGEEFRAGKPVEPPTLASSAELPAQPRSSMNGVLFLLSLSVLINYIDRSNLSIAAPLLQNELRISNTQLGTLLSAFFWTYALMQMPAGWLVDRFDVKWVFAAGFFLWSAATAMTGILHGFAALLAVRVVLGLGESVAFPSCSKVLGTHFQEARRGFANAIIMAGLALGPAIGMMVGGHAVARFGWRPFFLVLGFAAMLWLPVWMAAMPRRTKPPRFTTSPFSGLLPLIRQRSAWGTCIGQFCVNYYLYFLVTWLPSYLVRGRHLPMTTMARDGGLLFLMSAVAASIWGKLSDRWTASGSSITFVRKGSMAIGCTGVGISLALTSMVPETALVWMMVPTGTFLGISCCATWAIPQTLAGPEMVGRWTGMQNFIGNFAGAVAPALTGYLLDRTGEFYLPFFITAGVAFISALVWTLVIGPIEPVDWDRATAERIAPLSHTAPLA